MTQSRFRLTALASALLVTSVAQPALAGVLEEVVVTGTPKKGVSKFDATVSINTLSEEQITQLAPRSAAEVLRTIPGIRSESSAGEGNTNIAVRGVPVAAGGSKFVQLQEDGMPIMQFGDIVVGTADQFLRIDSSVRTVEALKGSTAATATSNAPAGIINFISKTGEDEGGSVSIATGLDYDNFRTDFEYGGPINDEWRFHVGGFYREGEGAREVDFNASKGGQIKANLTREFDGGYVRFYAKYLNDSVPTYLPMPMTGSQGSISGFDAGTSSNISNDLRNVLTTGGVSGVRRSGIDDGNHSEAKSFGMDFVFDIAEDLTVSERFRYNQNSGTFFGAFSAAIGSTSDLESLSTMLAGTGADGLAYVSGANAGVELSAEDVASLNGNGLLQNIRTFDNELESLDNFTNDLRLTKFFDNINVTLGYYKATQEIDVDWFWQTYVQDVSDQARLMDVYAGGNRLTQNGQLAYGSPDWGNCCTRDTYLEADLDAFYLSVNAELTERLTVDASVRYDTGDANGHYAFGTTLADDINNDGTSVGQLAETSVTYIDQAQLTSSKFDYDWDYWSYSLAANYLVTDYLAVFGSVSQGSRVNADRLGDGGYLLNGTAASGSVENELTSYELGVKWDSEYYSLFSTLFYVETDDVNSEATNPNGSTRVRGYESLGLELEGTAQFGDLLLRGSLTWTDAEIVSSNDPSLIGNTPRRQADFVWSLSPSYVFGEHVVGATVIGTTDAYDQDDNTYEMDGYVYANLFADFALAESLHLILTVNNVTDEVGLTEKEGGSTVIDGTEYIRARSIAGRTTELKLKYTF
ncbi:TonB-dependent receptor [Aestuariicella hydrocarbonica]|uniref:TonB-dependent receptor n=1 Tax=Pseudomaricurvus hydrocarbonicus TaxID=1470433 RepID=A0A9E5MLD4_9GAMM|nr:TonB-dependent receptor [Aestuariicella hydrocarbonica]NHO64298.1 TonB-dependent receptor [Aestuariicella hydrocarbonica]